MADSVDPDQTAPIGAVCSGSTLFAWILNSSVMLDNICSRRLQQTTFSDAIFLGALRVNFVQVPLLPKFVREYTFYIISVHKGSITYYPIRVIYLLDKYILSLWFNYLV